MGRTRPSRGGLGGPSVRTFFTTVGRRNIRRVRADPVSLSRSTTVTTQDRGRPGGALHRVGREDAAAASDILSGSTLSSPRPVCAVSENGCNVPGTRTRHIPTYPAAEMEHGDYLLQNDGYTCFYCHTSYEKGTYPTCLLHIMFLVKERRRVVLGTGVCVQFL